MPRLYLHIGHAKCGSTTLQSFLMSNSPKLRERGWLVPDAELRFPTEGHVRGVPVSFFERAIEHLQATGENPVRSSLDAAAEFLARTGGRGVVLSAENLSSLGRSVLFAEAAELFEVHVVYYVRRQDDWLLSAWKQWGVKQGTPLEKYIEPFVARPHNIYKRVLEEWSERHIATVCVRPLHPSGLHAEGLVADFCARCGIERDGLVTPPDDNVALDYDLLRVLNQSPELFRNVHDNELFTFLRAHQLRVEGQATGDPIGTEMRRRIMEHAEPENRWLHERYFPDLSFDELFAVTPRPPLEHDDFRAISKVLGLQLRILMRLSQKRDD